MSAAAAAIPRLIARRAGCARRTAAHVGLVAGRRAHQAPVAVAAARFAQLADGHRQGKLLRGQVFDGAAAGSRRRSSKRPMLKPQDVCSRHGPRCRRLHGGSGAQAADCGRLRLRLATTHGMVHETALLIQQPCLHPHAPDCAGRRRHCDLYLRCRDHRAFQRRRPHWQLGTAVCAPRGGLGPRNRNNEGFFQPRSAERRGCPKQKANACLACGWCNHSAHRRSRRAIE